MNKEEIEKIKKKVSEKLESLTTEELEEMLKIEPGCNPDTCNGECQGMGWCDTCKEFRKENFGTEEFDILGMYY
ncbi:MAG: hypothetical protein RBT05_06955 [Bacteroidales bacterium]|jgi:hypothetical protein|nr:hypothetical protein [Bacteroidales bacterium]